MTKECPSCGNVVEAGQLYCPVCGTKINNVDQLKKSINSALENDLARAEVYASAVLYEKSTIKYEEVNQGELNFLNLIDKYPTEPKVYIAYVNYITKYIDHVFNIKSGDAIYFNDINGLIGQCRSFLNNATKYNIENDVKILQEISRLQGVLQSLKTNQSEIIAENKKNKKIATWGSIGVIIFFILLILSWFI